jgi:hypothetical protein
VIEESFVWNRYFNRRGSAARIYEERDGALYNIIKKIKLNKERQQKEANRKRKYQ